MNVLVVEDEDRVADFLCRGLKGEGWTATRAGDGETALSLLKEGGFDVVLLDIMLPGLSGHEVCTRVRARGDEVPILMLTALDATDEKIVGLRKGADDYLSKPFSFDELIARMEALHRRTRARAGATPGVQAEDPVQFDREALCLKVDGEVVELSTKERDLLALLLGNAGRVMSRERILNAVWGLNEDPMTNTVDVYVGRVRRKLGDHASRITTVRGAGYRYDAQDV
ncbi:response regulator transcription factor [Halomonas sp. OfavH-34-E]|uniref:response regulator transcription factor n=1 Tax=Halomonas sp. OfavH-34-E TaxID=2954491 RepID=UPI0020971D88|nr:response regulator transcription factor [Gammaproteobacteria bacterium]MCO7214627.1 response regulator transcription factor [Halomonas sp. OfavH-34-E]